MSMWDDAQIWAKIDKHPSMEERIIDIFNLAPHRSSMVICLKCYARWLAVRPVGTLLKDLECRNCGQGYVIETGEILNDA